ncbi:TPA: hypothetical protein ACWLUJ_005739 [Pseudomonas aeruginosa]|nr:hypothetical protein [Pseudomonas aeruginosa]
MRWQLIDAVVLDKPVEGDPCNGCGLCCVAQVCDLGLALGDDRNCRALIQNEDFTFSCGLVVDPYRFLADKDLEAWLAIDRVSGGNAGEEALKQMNAEALGAGRGCDADDEEADQILSEAGANWQLSLRFTRNQNAR